MTGAPAPGGTGPGAAAPVRVAVVGCGAIGSLYAAHLARVPGVEVWAVDPWAEHVAAIEAEGLRVTGQADFTAPGAGPDGPGVRMAFVADPEGNPIELLHRDQTAVTREYR